MHLRAGGRVLAPQAGLRPAPTADGGLDEEEAIETPPPRKEKRTGRNACATKTVATKTFWSPARRGILGALDIPVDIGVFAEKEVIQ